MDSTEPGELTHSIDNRDNIYVLLCPGVSFTDIEIDVIRIAIVREVRLDRPDWEAGRLAVK